LTLIGAANEGYFWLIGNIGLVERVLIFICGLLFAFPETTTDIIGFFGVIAVLIEIWLRKRIVSRKEIAVSGIK
jgi:TRAP-type uncharacterized transport system fused permease subunit